MAGSTFGTLFRVTTFGESHCKGVGAIVDGVPPCMKLTEADIQPQLTRRRPGQSRLTTPRDETDRVTIMSGTEGGLTLGTPIALFVPNENVRPGDYAEMLQVPRPGHAGESERREVPRQLDGWPASSDATAGRMPPPIPLGLLHVYSHPNVFPSPPASHLSPVADYTYSIKYGIRASSGGGRASARETIGRVAAGAIAEKWLREQYGTEVVTFVSSIGTVDLPPAHERHPSGRPWTRGEVDRCGTLTILRDAKAGWSRLVAPIANGVGSGSSSSSASEKEATAALKKQQLELDAADERAFVDVGRGIISSSAYAEPATPCYEDADGVCYDRHGNALPGVTATQDNRTDELVVLRCPHAPTACKMASLIRDVKDSQDSTGGVLTTVISRVPMGLGW